MVTGENPRLASSVLIANKIHRCVTEAKRIKRIDPETKRADEAMIT